MLGWSLLNTDSKTALESAQRAVALGPDNPRAFDVAARAARKAGKRTEAIDYATRYRELLPNSARANRRYGETLQACGKHKQRHEALASVEEAINLDPNDAVNWNALGDIQARSFNDKKAAQESFEKALELDPNNAFAKTELAYVIESSGDKGTALSLVQSVIRLDPTDQFARKQLDDIVIRFMSDLLWATMIIGLITWFVLQVVFGGST